MWNPFGLGDFTYSVNELNMLIAVLAPDPHVHLVAATQLKFLKREITFIIT